MRINEPLFEWLYQHHKEAYEYQLERADKIRDRISFLVGLLSALGGAIIYLLAGYAHSSEPGATFFYLPMYFSVFFFGESVALVLFCLGRGFKMSYIPTPVDIQSTAVKLCKWAIAKPDLQIKPERRSPP